jgi:hypothetical protein
MVERERESRDKEEQSKEESTSNLRERLMPCLISRE